VAGVTGEREQTVLILTPVKNAARHAESWQRGLESLTYPRRLISIGVMEGDSDDGTYERFAQAAGALRGTFRGAGIWKRDFGFRIPPGVPRWEPAIQVARRSVLARSRNHLLLHALDDEEWVLWLDADVIEYPPDVIERLLAAGQDIVHPHCVLEYGGRSYDTNAWRDHGTRHLHDLRAEGDLVPLDSVGGTMLLVRADVHRDGIVFPSFPYGLPHPKIRTGNHWRGEIETEGLAMMAADAGIQCWGMPWLEIRHANG
jgi:glycosyltransferase involved in cell wall biosynthesis